MKTIDQFFADWESHYFGYGYGSGEEHTLSALKTFMGAMRVNGNYDYKILEEACTPAVAWLLINTLCKADVLEYGTSPRYGWLTPNGTALAHYIRAQSLEQLLSVVEEADIEYTPCFPDYCNCEDGACRKQNPLWPNRLAVTEVDCQ